MFKALRAILAQHRRLDDVETTLRGLVRSAEDLREDLDYLAADVKKLRGRTTGGSRKPPEPDSDGQGPTAEQINAAIRAGTFSLRRR